jgi:hypothetical protein
MASERGDLGVEDEAAAGVRPPSHHEHAHPLGQFAQDRAEVLVELEAFGQLGEADRGLLVVGQRVAARRAEVRNDLVLVAAMPASHRPRVLPTASGRGLYVDVSCRLARTTASSTNR